MTERNDKRKDVRFYKRMIIYDNSLENKQNTIIGYTNNISSGGICLSLNIFYPYTTLFNLKIEEQSNNKTKLYELCCSLKWVKNNFFYHSCGFQFLKLNDDYSIIISLIFNHFDETDIKIYFQPSMFGMFTQNW